MIRLLFGKQRNPYASFQIYRYDDARTRHVPKPTNKEESQEILSFTPQQHAHKNIKMGIYRSNLSAHPLLDFLDFSQSQTLVSP